MKGYQTQMLRIQINIQDRKAVFSLLLYYKKYDERVDRREDSIIFFSITAPQVERKL